MSNSLCKAITKNPLKIDNLCGTKFFTESETKFDPDFKKWQIEKSSKPSKETSVIVYEITTATTIQNVFEQLSKGNLDTITLTPHQILKFAENFRNWLSDDGYATFFLIKVIHNYYVIYLRKIDKNLNASVLLLSNKYIWPTNKFRRVVIPIN